MSSVESLMPRTAVATRRFAVAWRNRRRRLITPVAVLDHRAAGYRFQYLNGVETPSRGSVRSSDSRMPSASMNPPDYALSLPCE